MRFDLFTAISLFRATFVVTRGLPPLRRFLIYILPRHGAAAIIIIRRHTLRHHYATPMPMPALRRVYFFIQHFRAARHVRIELFTRILFHAIIVTPSHHRAAGGWVRRHGARATSYCFNCFQRLNILFHALHAHHAVCHQLLFIAIISSSLCRDHHHR